jgi:hypothetical protein
MAARLLTSLVVSIALFAAGYWWGHDASENAWMVKQAKADQKVRAEIDAMTGSAARAAVRYVDELTHQKERYANLARRYRDLRGRHPLVVPGPVVVAQCPPNGREARTKDELQGTEPDAANGGPRLTLAAVRMWNGALTGVDQPAGACGIDGATGKTDSACAEDAGLSLDDAWANHEINARTCAEDRERFRSLIELLQTLQQGE